MTDELTPQEKEALENLPRERMPLGLEARVVGAMREKGFLAKQRRTIEITNSHVAGLIAACLALMIGTYSIGLHRGGGDRLVPSVATLERDDRGPVIDAPGKKTEGLPSGDVAEAERPAPDKVTDTKGTVPPESRERVEDDFFEGADVVQQPAADADRSDMPQPEVAGAAKPSSPPTRSVEQTKADDARQVQSKEEGLAVSEQKAALPPPLETPVPQGVLNESAGPTLTGRMSVDTVVSKRTMTFLLNGSPVLVEAPDSVRVTQDDGGRVLVIYTSDGVIRIRLDDDD